MVQKGYRHKFGYYVRVWFAIFKACLKRSYIYKTEVFIRFLRTLFVLGVQIILLNAVFGDQDVYVGWTKNEAYLVMGIWNTLNYLGWSLFGVNLVYLESKVLRGEFDFILLKPLASDWLASFGDFFVYNMVTAISGVILIGYYIVCEWTSLNLVSVLLGVVSMMIGLLIWYGFYLLFASFTISKPRNGFLAITKELLGITKYPIDIFVVSFQVVFYSVVPIAFLTTVPANILMGKYSYVWLIIGFLVAISLIAIARIVWKKNIRNYTSAGG